MNLKQDLHHLFTQAIDSLKQQALIPSELIAEIHLERPREAQHGDFACNLAMTLAKQLKQRPRDIAEKIVAALPQADFVAKVDIAGAGFINITLAHHAYHAVITHILTEKQHYGTGNFGASKSVILEFVSANPTGPLHVGHGRGAAYGAALANLLAAVGYRVHTEYYVNDAGRQMDILATSVWLRYLELCGEQLKFPANGYRGDYVWDIAASLHREYASAFHHAQQDIFNQIPPDVDDGGDKEAHIDALITQAKLLLGKQNYLVVFDRGLNLILDDIRQDLLQFKVSYDHWFSERSLSADLTATLERLKANGHTYEKDGALWFRSSTFGDEKDRVLLRENGQFTYFTSDIAYHLNKLNRGFDLLINIWGADHHGYISRVKAALTALDYDANRLNILLVQFATLYRGKERLQMSTRSGEFVTLRELREDVGADAARFFYVQRKSEQHLDFDLELAKTQTSDNPVYYVQYAHARISSVFREARDKGLIANSTEWQINQSDFTRLEMPQEHTLLRTLSRYPEMLETAAAACEPHQITYYLRELAQDFHVFYNAHKILIEDESLRYARLSLIAAVQQVLYNGLTIIGVSAPEVM
jgi:arginyl-tRNA synthetase